MKILHALLAALCTLLFTTRVQAATTVNFGTLSQVNGPGSLDLAGEIPFAINFSANDGPMFVNGVKFVPDTALAPGLAVGPQSAAPWQTKPSFGATVDHDNLEEVFQDIRWANNGVGETLQVHLPVTAGETYKLQVLFSGNNQEDRRWDIEVEGNLAVDEVSSLGATTGGVPGTVPTYSVNAAVAYTYTLTATDSTLDVRMGSLGGNTDTSAPSDRNPIWQGFILEHIVPDTDSDGLPDAWETATFGGLAQSGTDDSDSDGLLNQFEYQLGSNATVDDTDADGLKDGAEYFTHRTNVLVADTDGDGLNDGAEIAAGSSPFVTDTDGDGLTDLFEVNTSHSNPADRDSDDDDYFDNMEVNAGTNPNSAASYPLYSTQVLAVSGGDQAEGLDLTGTFIAAARFGLTTMTGSWPVRDATFIPYHAVPGLTHNSVNQIDAWTTMNFAGPRTTADNNLATVMRSIRYQSGVFSVNYAGLTPGRSYKVQLIFAENCCATRGFDVYIENALVADEFSPPAVQGGPSASPAKGAAVIYGFVATDSTLNIRLDKSTVTTAALSDPNPILNALTVEEIPAGADLDADGLPDQWEINNFGNTGAQTGSGDPDGDGLLNNEELTSNTNPNAADTDGDGVNDGTEVHTSGTNPRVADSDNDGVNDGLEISTYHTNPLDPDSDDDTLTDGMEITTLHSNPNAFDSDGDGFSDPTEAINNTDPASPASKPGDTHVSRVFGPDAGEGLDLFGNFLYAFNVGVPGAAGPVHDANFTADSAPGIALIAPNEVSAWFNPDFGTSADETNLETVFQSIRWADVASAPPNNHITLDLSGLTAGRQYKLQLLFAESCCPGRFFDVNVNGGLIADEFNPYGVQGGSSGRTGAAIVHTFTATGTSVNITLDGSTTVAGTDHNATLSGVTLEEVVVQIPVEITGFSKVPGGLKIDIRGTPNHSYSVDWSPDLASWEEVNDALTPNGLGNASWTDMNVLRVGPTVRRGFYKVRDPAIQPTP